MKKLYRPVGLKELDLILSTDCKRYPERLPTQPIFYPVLNQEYAIEIAKNWNTKDSNSGFAGYVTEFDINEEYISKYDSHIVGAARHKELWVPAERLSEFNSQIIVPIRISHAFYGEQYVGQSSKINSNNYMEQLISLKKLKNHNPMDFSDIIQTDWRIVTLNFLAWVECDYAQEIEEAEKKELLNAIREILIQNQKWFFTF